MAILHGKQGLLCDKNISSSLHEFAGMNEGAGILISGSNACTQWCHKSTSKWYQTSTFSLH